jgi:hypothetical protein
MQDTKLPQFVTGALVDHSDAVLVVDHVVDMAAICVTWNHDGQSSLVAQWR